MQFLQWALRDLMEAGAEVDACQLMHDRIQHLPDDLAAQIIVLVHNRYQKWLGDDAGMRVHQGALQCIRTLVDKLLPVAKQQVVIFQHPSKKGERDYEPAAVVRFSPELHRTIAYLYRLVRDNGLAYVVRDLSPIELG